MDSHGKDIYTEDMFVVPTWKDTQCNITAYFPDVDMKDFLVLTGWTDATGQDTSFSVTTYSAGRLQSGILRSPFARCLSTVYLTVKNIRTTFLIF